MPDEVQMKTVPVVESKPGELKSVDWKSIGITVLLVAVSAAITKLIELLGAINFTDGNLQMVTGLVLVILKIGQKALTSRTYVVKE